MTATTEPAPRAAAPWHFWVIAVLSLLWNGFGGYDYTMSHVQGEPYYRQMGMTDAQIAMMNAYPSWMHAVWAIGVWGSVVGSVLLLLRSKFAFHAFGLSAVAAIGALAYDLVTPQAKAAMSPVMPVVIVVVCLFFVWYASTMTKRGVLR